MAVRRIRMAALGALFLTTLLTRPAPAEEPLTPEQKQAVEGLIQNYVREHPEIVAEALQKLQQRQEEAQVEARKGAIADLAATLASLPKDFIKGNPEAEVSVVEFFDYRCPYCKAVAPSVDALLAEDKEVRVLLLEFPILGPESEFASRAAIAARLQGKYMPLHDAMMRHKGKLERDGVIELAKKAGIDTDRMLKDMQAPEVEQLIRQNYMLGEKLGVTGTPAFVIGDELIPGAIDVETMKEKIKQARQS
jgi:protein-disulfide isomerase